MDTVPPSLEAPQGQSPLGPGVCLLCDAPIGASPHYMIGPGWHICSACIADGRARCCLCGSDYGIRRGSDGRTFCQRCRADGARQCSHCDEIMPLADLVGRVTDEHSNLRAFCRPCSELDLRGCPSCRHWRERAGFVAHDGEHYCALCVSKATAQCATCRQVKSRLQTRRYRNNLHCINCIESGATDKPRCDRCNVDLTSSAAKGWARTIVYGDHRGIAWRGPPYCANCQDERYEEAGERLRQWAYGLNAASYDARDAERDRIERGEYERRQRHLDAMRPQPPVANLDELSNHKIAHRKKGPPRGTFREGWREAACTAVKLMQEGKTPTVAAYLVGSQLRFVRRWVLALPSHECPEEIRERLSR